MANSGRSATLPRMGQILKLRDLAPKFGYKRVHRRVESEDPAQLQLFTPAPVVWLDTGLGAYAQALMLDERGDPGAAEWYLKAIEEVDCVADAYCNLGIIESRRGHRARAFDCFLWSLKQDPRHLEAHFNLGNLYFEVGDYRLAQVHYEIAVEIDPRFANVYFNLGLARSLNEEFAGAISALRRYQGMVGGSEARKADGLLEALGKAVENAEKLKS